MLKRLSTKLNAIRDLEKGLANDAVKRDGVEAEQGLVEQNFLYQTIAECRSQLTVKNLTRLITEIATLCVDFGEYATAEALYSDALGIAGSERKNFNEAAEALQKRADVLLRQARWDAARRDLKEARHLFTRSKNEIGVGKTENSLGIFMAQQGKAREGVTHFKKAVSVFEKEKQSDLASTTNMNLGILATMMGNYDEALTAYERALPEFEREGDVLRLAELHHNLGMLFLARSEMVTAIEQFDESLVYAQQAHYEELIGLASLGKATAYAQGKDFALALLFDNRALSIFRQLNAHPSIADSYKVKGIIQRGLKQYAAAELYFHTSLNLNEGHNSPQNLGETYCELGVLYEEMGNATKARRMFQKSLQCFQQVGAKRDAERVKAMLNFQKNR